MTDSERCPSCGAMNVPGATWCNQCFASLVPEAPPQRTEIATVEDPPGDHAGAPAFTVGDRQGSPVDDPAAEEQRGTTWTCRRCETVNPLSSDVCSVCQTPIFVSFGAEEDAAPALTPDQATTQAMVPGLAHIRMGHTLIGITIGLLAWILVGFAIVIAVSAGSFVGALISFLMAVGIVGVSVFDAQQIAGGRANHILLKPRTLTIVAVASIALVVLLVWVLAASSATPNP